jgi:hypothetical protein
MAPSNAIEQILARLPNVECRSTIWVLPGEQEDTWNVVIDDKGGDTIPLWRGLPEDPTPTLQQYIAANPDQQLQIFPLERSP